MELTIYEPSAIPEIRWNKEDIKREVSAMLTKYDGLVYTDKQIKDAKADRAKLNKLYKALDDKRKEMKKLCMAPYEKFESEMKEVLALISEQIGHIDGQVKEYEEVKKKEKFDQIQQAFIEEGFQPFVTFEAIYDPKWLNASVSMKQVKEALEQRKYQIGTDIHTLNQLPEFGFEAKEVYKKSLNLQQAIAEARRMSDIAKAKAEAEKQRAEKEEQERREAEERFKKASSESTYEPIPDVDGIETDKLPFEPDEAEIEPLSVPEGEWIKFEACLTVEQALMLKEFFETRGIKFRAI